MTPSTPCPDRRDLQAYSQGTLPRAAAPPLEDHLSQCAACLAALESLELAADELIVGLRHVHAARPDPPAAPLVDELVQTCVTALSTCRDAPATGVESGLADDALEPDISRMPVSADDLLHLLSTSGLLPREVVRHVARNYPQDTAGDDAVSLARWLVEQQQLTCFQAAELCCGRGAQLLLGEYVLQEEIGRGGMGCVYRAHNAEMDRVAAVKVLSPQLFQQPESQDRFRRETRAISKLSHPHVVAAYDAGRQAGRQYLAMEYVAGVNLGVLVRWQGPLPWRRAANYVRQAAEGLGAAHRQGIVHRDVKPANLLVSRQGAVKVSDLGLARFLTAIDHQDELTESGQILGTCDYMSPEQAFDVARVDERADIYSLGWTLYHLMTGEVPFPESTTRLAKLISHRDAAIPSLRDKCPDVPADLDQLFQRMVGKLPADRPRSMRVVGDVLRSLGVEGNDEPPHVAPPARPPDIDAFFHDLRERTREARRQAARYKRTRRRRTIIRWVVMATAAATAASAVFASGLLWRPAHGELAVVVGDGHEGEVQVRVSQEQQVVATLDASRGWRARLVQGAYALALGKGGDRYYLDRNRVDVGPDHLETVHVKLAKRTRQAPDNSEIGQTGLIELSSGRVTSLALSPDRSNAYAGCSDGTVYAVDLERWEVARRLTGHLGQVVDMAVSPDGTRLATCSGDRTIRIWDALTGDQTAQVDLSIPPWRVTFSPDSRYVLASTRVISATQDERGRYEDQSFRSLMRFDSDSGATVELADDQSSWYWSVAYSPDGATIAAGEQKGHIHLIRAASGGIFRILPARWPGEPTALAFSPDSQRLYCTNHSGFLTCHTIADGRRCLFQHVTNGLNGIDIGAGEERLLLSGTIDVQIVDLQAGGNTAVKTLPGHTSPISGLQFLADESQAVSASWDGTLRRWKLPEP